MFNELKIYTLFVGLWLALFIVIRFLFPSGIVFYQGVIVSFVIVVIFVTSNLRSLSAALAILFTTLFINGVIITTVDRAYSVKMIGWIGSNPSGMKIEDIESLFSNKFIREGGVDKRIKEQIASGVIEINNGEITLTNRGYFFEYCFNVIRFVFNLR